MIHQQPGARAPPRGRRPAPRGPHPGPLAPKQPPASPSSRRATGRAGDRAGGRKTAVLPSSATMAGATPSARARRLTSWKAPGWPYLTGTRWGHRPPSQTYGDSLPLGDQHQPVCPCLPPRELPGSTDSGVPTSTARSVGLGPSAADARAHSPGLEDSWEL